MRFSDLADEELVELLWKVSETSFNHGAADWEEENEPLLRAITYTAESKLTEYLAAHGFAVKGQEVGCAGKAQVHGGEL